jgi:hypothetical protein
MGKTANEPLNELLVTVKTFERVERVSASAVWC